MAELELPSHVVSQRRDGRREILLHRSMAVISEKKIEVRAARGLVIIPVIALLLSAAAGYWMATSQGSAPLWLLVLTLLALLLIVPVSVMSLVSAIAGADVVIDATKGSATWQQGYLGMGIGTKELVPFHKIGYLEVVVEGEEPDRWQDLPDDLRQFSLWLVKKNGKRLRLSQIPVPAYGEADGMDRTLALANAVATLAGTEVRLPEGWELVEIDTDTGEIIERPVDTSRKERREDAGERAPAAPRNREKRRGRRA